jgi:hypothetical protein
VPALTEVGAGIQTVGREQALRSSGT